MAATRPSRGRRPCPPPNISSGPSGPRTAPPTGHRLINISLPYITRPFPSTPSSVRAVGPAKSPRQVGAWRRPPNHPKPHLPASNLVPVCIFRRFGVVWYPSSIVGPSVWACGCCGELQVSRLVVGEGGGREKSRRRFKWRWLLPGSLEIRETRWQARSTNWASLCGVRCLAGGRGGGMGGLQSRRRQRKKRSGLCRSLKMRNFG